MKRNYYIAGFTWDGDSQLDRFKEEHIWENGYDEKYKDVYNTMRVGDHMALKSTYVKNSKSYLRIFCTGVIKKIHADKMRVEVDWKECRKDLTDITWYANTLCKIDNEEHIKRIFNMDNHEETKQDLAELLTTNYNLILTGAPGTGKTYLAKQIAQQIAAQNTYNPKELLEQIIGRFKHSDEETKRLNELRAVFLKRFPKEKLKDLTLEQYCIGDGGKDNFCWWIERGLTALGKYFPGSSRSYLVYRNKESLDYVFTGFLKNKKKDSNTNITNESLMKELASEISECVEKQKNIHNYLGDSFLLKILSTYYPNDFFPINSKTYLDNVIDLFGLENQKDILDKNKVVYNFYKIACKDRKDITVDEFAYILYSNFDLKTGEAVDSLKQRDSKEDYGFVQFHPSYDYTDFVEGLRPIQDENGNVGFERKDGVFKEFCVKALNNPNKNYVFIIDEINRGEISKIFGELFFSIDPGYRGENGKVRTQYANMQTVPNDFDDKLGITDDNNFGHFFVPKNVYIIGTMNDIDRSVESMDFAFRRRFAFKEIKADDNIEMLEELGELKDEAIERMKRLNAEISKIEGLSSAYHIGAAYFLKLKNYVSDADGGFENLWNNHLEGLLREYLRGSLNIEESIAKLEAAYNNESPENNG